MLRLPLFAQMLAAAALLSSCSSSPPGAVSAVPPDSGAPTTTPSPAETEGGTGAADASSSSAIAASEYCESVAGFFCEFYLRCERMVAADATECRAIFLETCNARYEPRYADLERAQRLSLTRAGVQACADHLSTVACAEQPFDLDGPCAAMWTGASPAGATCAADVESLVCAPGTTCVIGLDLCGRCETAVPRGGACERGVTRCAPDDACVDGACIARALPGQACSATKPCVGGSTCSAGTCVSSVVVGEGDACDAKHRCAYRTYCEGGTCVRGALLGEPCSAPSACMSGRCDGGRCVPLRAVGDACGSPLECSSGQCVGGTCASLPSACLAR